MLPPSFTFFFYKKGALIILHTHSLVLYVALLDEIWDIFIRAREEQPTPISFDEIMTMFTAHVPKAGIANQVMKLMRTSLNSGSGGEFSIVYKIGSYPRSVIPLLPSGELASFLLEVIVLTGVCNS